MPVKIKIHKDKLTSGQKRQQERKNTPHPKSKLKNKNSHSKNN